MKRNQLTRGSKRRLMYVENKQGVIDGVSARIGWVEFSQSGRSVYFHGRTLNRIKGGGVSGNFRDAESGEECWISGVKRSGSNAHWAESTKVTIDSDARQAYQALRDDTGE